MIITIRLDGVIADRADSSPLTTARPIPAGIVLVEALGNVFPLHVLLDRDTPKSLTLDWFDRQAPRGITIPWFTHIHEGEGVSETVLRTLGEQGTVLFHVDSDPDVVEEVTSAGVNSFLFRASRTPYPIDLHRKAFEALYD